MVGFRDYIEYIRDAESRRDLFSIMLALPFYVLSEIFTSLRYSGQGLHSQIHDAPSNSLLNFQLQVHEGSANFVKNMRCLDAICREHNAVFMAALQPRNGIGERQLTAEDNILLSVVKKPINKPNLKKPFSQHTFVNETFSSIKKECAPYSWFVDFTPVFDNETEQVFCDTVHFSDRGQRIVAEELYNVLIKKGLK